MTLTWHCLVTLQQLHGLIMVDNISHVIVLMLLKGMSMTNLVPNKFQKHIVFCRVTIPMSPFFERFKNGPPVPLEESQNIQDQENSPKTSPLGNYDDYCLSTTSSPVQAFLDQQTEVKHTLVTL